MNSLRNKACYCSAECRQAVHLVLDRERKWKSRQRFATRAKRKLEYEAARHKRVPGSRHDPPSPLPDHESM
ncbi:MAG: hypothetical protein ACKV0T_10380 [Planctomycetales bacterium]